MCNFNLCGADGTIGSEGSSNHHIHSCDHYSALLRLPWKMSSSVKKENKDGSYHIMCTMRHLKRNCTEEGHNSVKHSIKATKLKEKKHKEEATEIIETFILRKELKLLPRRRNETEQLTCNKPYHRHYLSR